MAYGCQKIGLVKPDRVYHKHVRQKRVFLADLLDEKTTFDTT